MPPGLSLLIWALCGVASLVLVAVECRRSRKRRRDAERITLMIQLDDRMAARSYPLERLEKAGRN